MAKTFTVKRTAVYDGQQIKAGATVAAGQLRDGVLQAALRTGFIIEDGAEPVDEDPPENEPPAPEDPPADPQEPAGSVADLGLHPRIVAALEAADLVTLDALADYLDQHGTFAGIKGIAAKSDKTIQKALAAE